ncbi:allophanate hydrolase, partial [Rhizobium leguminosarum]|nr:allophanate hydrolase [Rhizobium leguminosarum]
VQTFPFSLRFERRVVFAVTGADGNPHLDGSELLAWCAYLAEPGQVLELKQPPRLARSYISLGGGLDIPVVMGSRSTSLRGGFGGNAGRPLAKGDRIAVGEDAEIAMLPASGLAVVEPGVALRDVFPAAVDGALPIRALP